MDAETMEAIEKWAADEFRSTNGQLQWIIAEALRKSGRMKKKKTIIKLAGFTVMTEQIRMASILI